jgi:hypothetical protein
LQLGQPIFEGLFPRLHFVILLLNEQPLIAHKNLLVHNESPRRGVETKVEVVLVTRVLLLGHLVVLVDLPGQLQLLIELPLTLDKAPIRSTHLVVLG